MNLLSKDSIKGIFFDLYGTLLDYNDMEKSNKIWVNAFHDMVGAPNNLSLDITEKICSKLLLEGVEKNNHNSLTTYEEKIKFQFEKIGVIFNIDQLRKIADESLECWQKNITLSEDSIPVLQKLKQHKKLALISNFDHTPHVKKVIADHKLNLYFNPIIISDEVNCSKPDPRIFQMALKKTNLKPNEVIFIGDSYSDDILGAKAANIIPVLIQHKSYSHAHNKVDPSLNIVKVQSLTELLELLS